MVIRDGTIASITGERPDGTDGVRFIRLGEQDWVFPVGYWDTHIRQIDNCQWR